MNDEITRYLLNDMPVAQFLAFYLSSLLGALIWFLAKTVYAIGYNAKTPAKFSPRHFWHGAAKFLLTVLILPWAVIYFPDYGPFLLTLLFEFPNASQDQLDSIVMNMNAGSALIIGFLIDMIVRKATTNTFKRLKR